MWREVDIIINLAATTNFDERYDVALGINTLGAKHVIGFAKKYAKIMLLVHVSTAYVCGEREGLILEKPFYMGETLNGTSRLDIDVELKLSDETLKNLHAEGASNDEITSTMKDLSIERTVDSIVVSHGKGKVPFFLGHPHTIIDIIPVDMVVNSILVAMTAQATANKPCGIIYQLGSSLKNPVKYCDILDLSFRYFTKKPLMNKDDGNPIIVGKFKVITSMDSFQSYMTIRYLLLLKGLEYANTAFCQSFKGQYTNLSRKIRVVTRLVELYRPYLLFKGVFDDMNTEKLRSDNQFEAFNLDPKCIDWEDYFMNIHLPGIVKHVLKQ